MLPGVVAGFCDGFAQIDGGGSINTTQDTGGRLAQAITAAPSMWTDRLKKQGTDSMTTTGQV